VETVEESVAKVLAAVERLGLVRAGSDGQVTAGMEAQLVAPARG